MNRRKFLASLFTIPLALKTKFFPAGENPYLPPDYRIRLEHLARLYYEEGAVCMRIERYRVDFLDMRYWEKTVDVDVQSLRQLYPVESSPASSPSADLSCPDGPALPSPATPPYPA